MGAILLRIQTTTTANRPVFDPSHILRINVHHIYTSIVYNEQTPKTMCLDIYTLTVTLTNSRLSTSFQVPSTTPSTNPSLSDPLQVSTCRFLRVAMPTVPKASRVQCYAWIASPTKKKGFDVNNSIVWP